MADKLWKKVEREVARILGGERVPVSGRQRGFSADVLHPRLSVEVKHKEELPIWVMDAMNQAQSSQRGTQIPIVVLHQKNMKYEDSLVVIRLSDFVKLEEK